MNTTKLHPISLLNFKRYRVILIYIVYTNLIVWLKVTPYNDENSR